MKALLAFFRLIPVARHNDLLRANQFDETPRFSPWLAFLERL